MRAEAPRSSCGRGQLRPMRYRLPAQVHRGRGADSEKRRWARPMPAEWRATGTGASMGDGGDARCEHFPWGGRADVTQGVSARPHLVGCFSFFVDLICFLIEALIS